MLQTTTKSLIVYADDDPDDLELVREAFENYSQNIEVLTFKNGAEVLSYLDNTKDSLPCLVILDINMPIVTGKEVLRQLREKTAFEDTPIVLFTTSANPADKEYAKALRAGYISKPIQYQQMGYIADQFISHCTEGVKKGLKREQS